MLQDGVYVKGLFLQGAGWDKKNACLLEAEPMQLVCNIPSIHFKPVEMRRRALKGETCVSTRAVLCFLLDTTPLRSDLAQLICSMKWESHIYTQLQKSNVKKQFAHFGYKCPHMHVNCLYQSETILFFCLKHLG